MNTKMKPYLFAALLGAAVPLAAVAQGEPRDLSEKTTLERAGDYASDAALTTKIKAALVAERELSAIDIRVETTQGVTTLSGTVDNAAQVSLAERVVSGLDGVKGVNNQLKAR